MKRILITLFAVWLSTSITVPDYAQEIRIGMPLSKLLPILADQKCHVDTTREGRIKSYIAQLDAYPFKMFAVEGDMLFCVDPGSDKISGWEWLADSMALTDYQIILHEITDQFQDSGKEIPPNSEIIFPVHAWGSNGTVVSYLPNNQVMVFQGAVCAPRATMVSAMVLEALSTATAPATTAPPPLPPDTSSPLVSEGPDNFTYDVVKDDVDPNDVWESITVKLSKKITQEQLASVAKRIRADKWRSDNLRIDVLLPGMNADSDIWASVTFYANKKDVSMVGSNAEVEPHLDLTFWISRAEQRRRAIDTAKRQKINGKVIGYWYEESLSPAVYILFEKKGKTFVRKIEASLEEGEDSWVMADEELTKSEVQGVTRLLEPDDSFWEYLVINKDGNLELYDKYGYITTGEKIQP